MGRKRLDGPRRQLFANIDEELYLKLKSKAASDRLSIREILEVALARYLASDQDTSESQYLDGDKGDIWEDDEYLAMQAERPLGSPVELTSEEAKKVALEGFQWNRH